MHVVKYKTAHITIIKKTEAQKIISIFSNILTIFYLILFINHINAKAIPTTIKSPNKIGTSHQ